MHAEDNHYHFLGLQDGAPRWEVEAAVDRLSERAAMLVYTSPQQSHELWERIRQIKDDLLRDEAQRQAYNEALLRSRQSVPEHEDGVTALSAAFRESQRARRNRRSRWLRPLALIGSAGLVAAALVAAIALARPPGAGSPVPSTPIAMTLSSSGPRGGSGYISGQRVVLRWSKVSGATRYQLQITKASSDPSDAIIFRHPWRTVDTAKTSYSFRAAGEQMYYWRVQPRVHGQWQFYTHAQHFLVARPAIGVPSPQRPPSGSAVFSNHVRMCWSDVVGASGYILRVTGTSARSTSSTCATLHLKAGTYRWSAAARVRGERLYIGTFSQPAILMVEAKPGRTSKRRVLVAARTPPQKGPRLLAVRPITPATPPAASTRRGRSVSAARGGGSASSVRRRTVSSGSRAYRPTAGTHQQAGSRLRGSPARTAPPPRPPRSVPPRHSTRSGPPPPPPAPPPPQAPPAVAAPAPAAAAPPSPPVQLVAVSPSTARAGGAPPTSPAAPVVQARPAPVAQPTVPQSPRPAVPAAAPPSTVPTPAPAPAPSQQSAWSRPGSGSGQSSSAPPPTRRCSAQHC